MKKLISCILAIVIAFSMFSICAFAETKTECDGNCDTCPAIVVPGIGQSNVWALDKNGDYLLDDNGNRISCFPAVLDLNAILPKAIFPVLMSLFSQKDAGLSDALCGAVRSPDFIFTHSHFLRSPLARPRDARSARPSPRSPRRECGADIPRA